MRSPYRDAAIDASRVHDEEELVAFSNMLARHRRQARASVFAVAAVITGAFLFFTYRVIVTPTQRLPLHCHKVYRFAQDPNNALKWSRQAELVCDDDGDEDYETSP